MECTFANFIIGSSNQFAHAASLAVANLPAQAYNPLFLYGGAGLGKTHLLQAIGHHLRRREASWRTMYVTAEHFMLELVSALKHRHMEAFRARYREVDILLFDDVHLLSGKEKTQEEFFHTFNALHNAGKQIVAAGARSPQDLVPLPERLRSRLEAGLTAALWPADLEMRVAILLRKAEEQHVRLSTRVAMLVASRLGTNMHELEGCLTRLAAHASLHAQHIDEELAETVLQQLQASRGITETIRRIQQTVATHFGIRTSDLASRSRLRAVALPRQIAMFLCREHTEASLQDIGRYFGGKNHTTVLHSCSKIARLEKDDEQMARALWQLRRVLGA